MLDCELGSQLAGQRAGPFLPHVAPPEVAGLDRASQAELLGDDTCRRLFSTPPLREDEPLPSSLAPRTMPHLEGVEPLAPSPYCLQGQPYLQ